MDHSPHLFINEADNHDRVSSLPFDEGSMKLVVKVLLHCLHSLIGWCIDLNDCSVLNWHLNLAEMVCSYIGSHSFKLFLTSYDMIIVTPNLCRVVLHHLPDQNRVLFLQFSNGPSHLITVYLVSITPRIACSSLLITSWQLGIRLDKMFASVSKMFLY